MRYDIIGIREFAEMLTREGGLTAGGTPSNRKALEGARLHRHIQKRLAAEHEVCFVYCKPRMVDVS